ncbi:hypothetical protein HYPSUDRAFT_144459 [Hypholoma sublateritium FD-334 SS-4]|uniref:Uncharacterized protein n=1 Tax=Hypholoma sublateritium (strain FD-334 SS-4) TaxID=945553 RepID=A0A0D2NQ10_HYPSF|nr:hypothetical protein HYPSUDRAFT_144459 [Hypholoma sublateritium FD-334 SS-4]
MRTIQDQIDNPPFTQPVPSTAADTPPPTYVATYAEVVAGNFRRPPSAGWLRNPAWIDGGINPPRYYYSHEEIDDDIRTFGGNTVRTTECNWEDDHISPTPRPPTPPSPLSLDLVNTGNPRLPAAAIAAPLPVPNEPVVLVVNVTLLYTGPPTVSSNNRGKATTKKLKIVKMDNIPLSMESTSRIDFIKSFLSTHGLAETFSPGAHSGPEFKLWWPGISGGKTGAPSILTDHQFRIAIDALRKKSKIPPMINVEFDLDTMEGYRIKEILPPGAEKVVTGTEEELAYGTRVPQIDSFSDTAQLNGRFVIELKKRWPCQIHQGEHGEVGYCYISPSGEHTRLNTLRMKTWAAALAAGDATKHEPPNSSVFDGARDGRIMGPKARGRAGPHASASNADAMTMFMTALLPILSRKRGRNHSNSPDVTPKRPKANSTSLSATFSPLPECGLELRTCLRHFAEREGIDLTAYEAPLCAEDYSPDIIPYVEDSELRKITGATAGGVIKLKKFCKEWYDRYEAKCRAQ